MASSRSPTTSRHGSQSPTFTAAIAKQPFAGLSDGSDSEDEDIFRPRGKFASQMLAKGNNHARRGLDSETDDNQPSKNGSTERSSNVPTSSVHNEGDNGDEDGEDMVVTARTRRLKRRRQRSATPESRPLKAGSSPSLFVSPEKSATTPAPDSPGLFLSPSKPRSPSRKSNVGSGLESDDDLPAATKLASNPRFKALMTKKREERMAKEAEEARKKANRLVAQQAADNIMDDEDDDEDSNITDDEGGRKLTQEAMRRPASRKASKKAIEEINRETQRLARNMQLAHEAKVKKKITKSALFQRFNFKPEGSAAPAEKPALQPSSRHTSPISALQKDTEMKGNDTPPSSVTVDGKDVEVRKDAEAQAERASPAIGTYLLEEDENGELPTLEAALESSADRKRLDKGKGKATTADLEAEAESEELPRVKRNLRVKLPALHANVVSLDLDDDEDELAIQPSNKSKVDAIFDRIPINLARESRSMQMLRRLANIDDPEKKAPVPAGKDQNSKHAQQPAMTAGELHVSLIQRARQQAKLERDRHLELLRSKGVHVPTAEEREKEMAQVDDIVARARKEAEEIMQREREAAKEDRKARKEAGEVDPLAWDDSEDDSDFQDPDEADAVDEEDGDAADVELSGSEDDDVLNEDEEDAASGDDDEAEDADPAGVLFDDLAESAEESETGDGERQLAGGQDSDEEVASSKQARRRWRKHVTIISDDDDDGDDNEDDMVKTHHIEATPRPKTRFPKSPSVPNTHSPTVPTSVLRSATKNFIPGLPVAGAAGLGLTQIFAGTMDDSQSAFGSVAGSPTQPMPTFDVEAFPDSNFSQTVQEEPEDMMVLDSQPVRRGDKETQEAETQGVQIRFSQSQVHGFDSLLQENLDGTQMSELEPTQDGGFHNFTPLRQRFVELPNSTIETVKLDQSQIELEHNESPLVRRTGKLRRRIDVSAAPPSPSAIPSSHLEEDGDPMEGVEEEADEFGFGTTAFSVMRDAAIKEKKMKAIEAFDKKKSKAREMVQEQAEESEDEYAGLGGADGEYSSDDDDHSVKEMIDDETKNNETDERKLAAFYAERERASDEKQTDKLFHDLTTGQLRKRRHGGDFDGLSDEDDGGEAVRRMKRRQFAKMQKALFADERISKVAENPRNQAFLRTIEDRGSDEEMDFILAPSPTAALGSQESQASATGVDTIIPDSQPHPGAAASTTAAAPNPRRTKDGKKLSNLGDIRESLSNLLDEPSTSSIIPATELGSDESDDEEEDDENLAEAQPNPLARPTSSSGSTSSNKENHNPRRTSNNSRRGVGREAIVDRISLKRNSSSNISTSRLAFATTSAAAHSAVIGGGFKVPALLRRATTNSLISTSSTSSLSTSSATGSISASATTSSKTTTGGGFGDDAKIKRTAGKRSGINYFARENERRAAVAESERRREAKKWKGAEGRSKVVGSLFGGGKFE
ncbi:hypothetical protein B0H63DRAFT_417914 [Podospora didyma]|uniref:DNA replication checkpoint mediator MRC1 domain-containing protein n=1 Tax=Podospora didyma TaxID=330526 RepID=A0AAE0KKY0_9PEZI|nr:hypothetical protein B0H63DRAFT_417914 [Podospora didyma]